MLKKRVGKKELRKHTEIHNFKNESLYFINYLTLLLNKSDILVLAFGIITVFSNFITEFDTDLIKHK